MRPWTDEDRADHLKILTGDLGFQPYAYCWYNSQLCELISFPFFARPGDKVAEIKLRTNPGDPTSMIQETVSRIQTLECFADEPTDPELPNFLHALARRLRSHHVDKGDPPAAS